MTNWLEKTKRPVLPVYMAALVWPIMALLVPIYTLGGLVLTAAVSAGAYFAGTKLCPTRVVRTYVPYATGSEDVDAMLNGIAANLDALHKLNEAIPDPQLSRAMDRMEKAGRSIAAVVEKTPDKARSVDRFARYYLPEVVKLMGTYAALEQNGVRGENAAQIEAELRRGEPCLHLTEGLGLAINMGDLALSMVNGPVVNDPLLEDAVKVRVIKELIAMTCRTVEGQALDLGWARDGRYDITPEDYLTMAIHKTAHYSGAVPLAVGAIVGSADDEIVEALRSYGLDTGLAFQIQDDLLNLVGTDEASNAPRAGVPFSRVREAVRTLQRVRKAKMGVHLELHFAYLMLASQMEAVEGLPDLMDELDVHAAVISTLDYIAAPGLEAEAFSPHEAGKLDAARDILERVAEEASASRTGVHGHVRVVYHSMLPTNTSSFQMSGATRLRSPTTWSATPNM